ncbi:MAG: hypothetical protein AAFP22_07505, partial [Planctomycetota bacterium]
MTHPFFLPELFALAEPGDGLAAFVNPATIMLAGILVLAGFVFALARRYKRCPSNRILVVYGRTGKGQ